jgi:5'-methylthioadenosine phosphorylase
MLGIISGTVLLHEQGLLDKAKETVKVNEFGRAVLMLSDAVALISRHGRDPQHHIFPHLINHRANLKALRDVGVTEVIGINSAGALKKKIKPGTIIIPDDFIMLTPCHSIHEDKAFHITPGLDPMIRRRCLDAACACGISAIDGGVYWQTVGPRLETKAEIKMISRYADIVGMTVASEAIIAKELALPYAALCSVDNYANGIGEHDITMEEISDHARLSGKTITRILAAYMMGK